MDKNYWVSAKSSGSKPLDSLKEFLQQRLSPDGMSKFSDLIDAVASGGFQSEKNAPQGEAEKAYEDLRSYLEGVLNADQLKAVERLLSKVINASTSTKSAADYSGYGGDGFILRNRDARGMPIKQTPGVKADKYEEEPAEDLVANKTAELVRLIAQEQESKAFSRMMEKSGRNAHGIKNK